MTKPDTQTKMSIDAKTIFKAVQILQIKNVMDDVGLTPLEKLIKLDPLIDALLAEREAAPTRASDRPDLDAMEARCAAATRGPWECLWDNDEFNDKAQLVVSLAPDVDKRVIIRAHGPKEWYIQDYPFIVHARTDLPDLIAYARRLKAENAKLKAKLKDK